MSTISHTLSNTAYTKITTGKELASVYHVKGNKVKYIQSATLPAIDDYEMTFTKRFGGSRGRMKFQFFDWNNRGVPDLLFGTPSNHDFRQINESEEGESFKRATIAIAKNVGTIDEPVFELPTYIKHKSTNEPLYFGHHSCAPEAYRWEDKVYLLVGAEDGHIYRFEREEFL